MSTAPSVADLRSDTVTRPSPAMRDAMRDAEVGDDVWGDDASVNALEAYVAAELGKEAALFLPSGTQSNLTAMLCHCQRGDAVITGAPCHVAQYEAAGISVLGSVALETLTPAADFTLPLDALEYSLGREDDVHKAPPRLLVLENTIHGRVLTLAQLTEQVAVARRHGKQVHLDGARLFNASEVLAVEAKVLCEPFDTVSVCLSKGLGAPVGSLLCGPKALIDRARHWRRMLGGGMRQAGVLAAAGHYALTQQRADLQADHRRAQALAEGLAALPGLSVTPTPSNMVFVSDEGSLSAPRLAEAAETLEIMLPSYSRTMRLVTHRDVDDSGIERAIEAYQQATQ